MPLLYPIGTLFFFLTYWFDKVSLMRYYQKTKEFNEELPISSVKLFKYAIIIHFMLSGFLYSSSGMLILNEEYNPSDFEYIDYDDHFESRINWPHNIIMLLFSAISLSIFIL